MERGIIFQTPEYHSWCEVGRSVYQSVKVYLLEWDRVPADSCQQGFRQLRLLRDAELLAKTQVQVAFVPLELDQHVRG